MMQLLHVTRFERPVEDGPFGKVHSLDADGNHEKTASAELWRGSFETLHIPATALALAELLQSSFSQQQALCASVCLTTESGTIASQALLTRFPGAITRSPKNFGFKAESLAVLTLDYDRPRGAEALTPDQLKATLLRICPAIARSIVLHWFSASSLIHRPDGAPLSGIEGQRIYLVVKAAADIPRAIKVINKHARRLGLGGHVQVSSSGALLTRHLFDDSMAQPARLDFAATGAICKDGLVQRRGPPTVWFDGEPLDTLKELPDLTPAQDAEVDALIAAERLRARPAADAAKAAWLAARQQEAAEVAFKAGGNIDDARELATHAHESMLGGVLVSSYVLRYTDTAGTDRTVAVEDLLKNPKQWNLHRFKSVHEPGHRGGEHSSIAYLLQPVPRIYDLHDHISYELKGAQVRFAVTSGNRAELSEQIAIELAKRPDLMNVAGQLSQVVDGAFQAVSTARLGFIIGSHCHLYRTLRENTHKQANPDEPLIRMTNDRLTDRARKVIGRSSIALIDPDGRMISALGFDPSGFYIEARDDDEPIPLEPTRAETVDALRRLWRPFSRYEFDTPHSRAAVLATVLTVPMRPTIKAVPGLCVTAAFRAAGKSEICRAIAVLVQGNGSNFKAWARESDAEMVKYLLSLARAGAGVVALDNISGTFGSDVIAASITDGMVAGRLLGESTALSPNFRAMWLASGNNASLTVDAASRYLQSRIACQDGKPHLKNHPFMPSDAALADRHGIIRSILIVHRAYHAAGRPQADNIPTRFPEWGRVIRQMVFVLASSGIGDEAGIDLRGADPADSILNRMTETDPETDRNEAFFLACHERFDVEPFTTADLSKAASIGSTTFDAIMAYFPRQGHLPGKAALNSLLRNRRDQHYAGLKLVMLPRPQTREGQRQGQQFALVPAP